MSLRRNVKPLLSGVFTIALLVLASQAAAARSQIRFENHQKLSRVDFIFNNSATDDKPVIDAALGGVALLETLSRDIILHIWRSKVRGKILTCVKPSPDLQKESTPEGPCLALPDVFQTGTDLSRALHKSRLNIYVRKSR